MRCAKCSDHSLVQLSSAGRVAAWTCPECGGVWIPDGKAAGAEPPPELLATATPATGLDAMAGLCPAGHGILTRAQSFVGSGFFLDRCAACSGVWFDRGEWQAVSAAGLAAGLFAMWTEPWQRAQRRQRSAAAYQRQLEEDLGHELVSRITELADALRQHPHRNLALGYLHGRMGSES